MTATTQDPAILSALGLDSVVDWLRGHTDEDLPKTRITPSAAGKWVVDEWALQIELAQGRMRIPDYSFRRRLREELGDARDLFETRGWIADPRSYHQDPPPIDDMALNAPRPGGLPIETFRFTSGYEPWPDEPGRDRWLDYPSVGTAHGWLLRHHDRPRPWLFIVNGYRTGQIPADVMAFRVEHLHHDLGLNIANVALPLHGPRALGDSSGARVFNSGAMNTVFTIAQGAWDIRRVLNWMRSELGAETIGMSGISLGGYMTALLSGLDDNLACAVAGVPESDLVRGLRRQLDPMLPPFYEQWGLSWAPLERVFTPVSPLALDCLVPHEHRYIYAGLLDRWVRPGNVKTLWEHWDEPAIHWYNGSHLSFPFERSVHHFVDQALTESLPLN